MPCYDHRDHKRDLQDICHHDNNQTEKELTKPRTSFKARGQGLITKDFELQKANELNSLLSGEIHTLKACLFTIIRELEERNIKEEVMEKTAISGVPEIIDIWGKHQKERNS